MFRKNASLDLSGFKNLTGLAIALLPVLCQAEFRDPTKPDYPQPVVVTHEAGTTADDNLVLSAIWISATGKRVTINGITAKEGQTILHNVKIIKISKNSVSLKHNGRLKILSLLQKKTVYLTPK